MDGESVDAVSESPDWETESTPELIIDEGPEEIVMVTEDIKAQNQTDSDHSMQTHRNELARMGQRSFIALMRNFPDYPPDSSVQIISASDAQISDSRLYIETTPKQENPEEQATARSSTKRQREDDEEVINWKKRIHQGQK